jgi:hypothetical protein
MTSVANQPFNTEKFNFAKINDSKELIFGLEFEQDRDKVVFTFFHRFLFVSLYFVVIMMDKNNVVQNIFFVSRKAIKIMT